MASRFVRAYIDSNSIDTNAYVNLDQTKLIKVVRNAVDTAWTFLAVFPDGTTQYLYGGSEDLQEACAQLRQFVSDTEIG